MKKLTLIIIDIYQMILSPFLHHVLGVQTACRYPLSCSAYTKQAIQKKGVIIGVYLGLKRILSCQPFSKKPYGRSI